MTRPADGRHNCPGQCGYRVARHQLSCRDCWYRLPVALREAVSDAYRTKKARPNDTHAAAAHRRAVADAFAWYRANKRSSS